MIFTLFFDVNSFRATLYPCPERVSDRREMINGVASRIEDLNTVLSQTTEHRHRILVAAAKNLKNWLVKVRKIKSIYCVLNICDLVVTTKCMIFECWIPENDFEKVKRSIENGSIRSGSSVMPVVNILETTETRPTFNRVNKVTAGFQNIVDSYGVASYQEINPAPFTIITFPFLFAVMFGDAGHGILMALFAAWMVLKERNLQMQKNPNEIWLMFFNGRYMILLMGLFSIYTGLMYNDIFSKSVNIFGSSWKAPSLGKGKYYANQTMQLGADEYSGSPYLLGVDPVSFWLFDSKCFYLAIRWAGMATGTEQNCLFEFIQNEIVRHLGCCANVFRCSLELLESSVSSISFLFSKLSISNCL